MFNSQLSKNFKERKIKLNFKEDIEPHEILLDSFAQRRKEAGFSEKRFEVPLLKKNLQGFLIVCFLLIFVLFAKTFQFQVLEQEKFSALAQQNKFIIHQIQAERGVIYDSDLNQLVFNQPSFDLVCKKTDLPQDEIERELVFREISEILNENPENLKRIIEESEERVVLISENLDYQTLIILETKIKELPGFQIKKNSTREYKDGSNFAHLIGYKRKTGEKTGLEKSYNEVLREKPGELRVERDALGNLITKEVVSLPESGKSLVLWLDSGLQKKIEEELKKILKNVGAEIGAAVALDPKTGGVLALVSLPSFDNNQFSKGMSQEEWELIEGNKLKPLFNRVISGTYPTGSTIKPLIASAVLEEKIISPEKKIYDPGFIEIPHQYDPEIVYKFLDWRVHGWTDMRKAIAESCNVYFYIVGGGYKNQDGLGPSRIKKYLEFFGWGSKTGIDLPQENEGFLPDPVWKKEKLGEIWYDGDTYHFSIGQGYLRTTPLQMAVSFVSIANRGKLFQPQVVKEIVDSEKNVIKEIRSNIIRENFINQENLQIVREGMRQAVTGENSPYASAILLSSLPVSAAAKTGTAQTGRKDPRDKEDYLDNWITVFAPYDDPQIVLTIMIKDIKGLQSAALPVAKEVLNWYFTQD